MAIPVTRLREFVDKRVKMRFDDGHECIAMLLFATQDRDGSLHLVFDKLEWENELHKPSIPKDSARYMPGESLVSIEEVPSTATDTFECDQEF